MNAIFAVNKIDGFGDGNSMPWDHSVEDMRHFKTLTNGYTVVMGAKTWLSDMPKPLPNRRNCVLSTTLVDSRCEVYGDVTSLLMDVKTDEKVFVIGGAKVLWSLRRYIDTVYLTRHKSAKRSEVTLDTVKYLSGFHLVDSKEMDKLSFEIWLKPDKILK